MVATFSHMHVLRGNGYVYVCKKNVKGKEREMLRENGWLQKFNEGERSKTSVDRTWKY